MGSKSSRHNSDSGEPLSKETIDELCQDSGFTEEELLNWHINFYKDCPDGKLTLKQFEHEYSKIMGKPTQKTSDYVKHMFNVYDEDKNQFIDFREFVMALSAASVVNRLRLVETLFSVFDLDADGKISKDEMGRMLQTLIEVTNSNRKRRHQLHHHHSNGHNDTKGMHLQKHLDDAFNELNTNHDDFITKDEFIEWYIKSGLLSDVKPNEINVPHTSRIQQLDKKSRKIRKQQLNTNNKEENLNPRPQLTRYMSHMTEQKSTPIINHYDNVDDIIDYDTVLCQKVNSDDTDSHNSKENERWQYLFNSVLGQIRSQRPEQIDNHQQEINDHNRISHFNSWKQQGEEKLKLEYYKQKSNDDLKSPNVISIRL